MANKMSLRIYKVLNDDKFKSYKEEYGLRAAANKWQVNYWTLYYHLRRKKEEEVIVNSKLSPDTLKYIARKVVKMNKGK